MSPSLPLQKMKRSETTSQVAVRKDTGGPGRLPVVKAPSELMSRAQKTARMIRADLNVKNVRNRARKHGQKPSMHCCKHSVYPFEIAWMDTRRNGCVCIRLNGSW